MYNALFRPDGRRFSLAFAGLTVCMLSAIAGLNYLVNPLNYYQTDLLTPLVQTTREDKVSHLKALPQAPDGLILGSSRVLKFEPNYLTDKTGCNFYNAGVTHAHAEDIVAMLRFYRKRFDRWPPIVLIGIDEFAFSDSQPIELELVTTADLAGEVKDFIPWLDRLQPIRSLVEWQQTKLSLRSIRQNLLSRSIPEKVESIEPDGRITYHKREREIAEGSYDFQSALQYNLSEYKQIIANFHSISPRRLELLSDTLKQCADSGTQITLFLTPLHPQLHQQLCLDPKYQDRILELDSAMQVIASQSGASIYDFRDPAAFDGDPSMFIDGIHPLESNTRKMINLMVGSGNGRWKLAIQ